jgi:hypothetical protein
MTIWRIGGDMTILGKAERQCVAAGFGRRALVGKARAELRELQYKIFEEIISE